MLAMGMDNAIQQESESDRVSINLRIDQQKHAILENMRDVGFGYALTKRNRSDVYNEAIGLGIQVYYLKNGLGDDDFEKLWSLIHKVNWKKLNIDRVEALISGSSGKDGKEK